MAYGPNWTGMREFAPVTWLSVEQAATNVEWPPDKIARLIPRQKPIPVRARVDFEKDGEVWLPGEAIRWLRPVVFVRLNDARVRGFGLWLPASDVRRA
jgi:hypothetical protein